MIIPFWPTKAEWSIFLSNMRMYGVILSYILFLLTGAYIFTYEAKNTNLISEAIQIKKNEFLEASKSISEEDLDEFLQLIIRANKAGISPLRNATNDLNWTFGGSLLYVTSLITTIGYGNVAPVSCSGRFYAMILAMLGIPLTLMLFTGFVGRLKTSTTKLLGVLNSKLGHLYQPLNIRILHMLIIWQFVAMIFFFVPAAVLTYLEPSWDYNVALYFCFISLTTIGFGDIMPGDDMNPEYVDIYRSAISVYLIFGLIAVMLSLTLFYDIPQLNCSRIFINSSSTLPQANSECEKSLLAGGKVICYSGPSGLYMPSRDDEVRRSVVRIRPHGNEDDSPSPDEPPTGFPEVP